MLLQCRGRRHIAVDRVVECRNVRRTLDGGVAAQRHDARTRTADVPQEKLQPLAGALVPSGPVDTLVSPDCAVAAAASPCAPTLVRAYCQVALLYSLIKPLNGHSATPPLDCKSPENTPSKSSVSLKSSLMIVAA